MNSTGHKKHHYIPVCYLRNFSLDKEIVWVYNKKVSKCYQKNINDIFYKKDFYTLDECYIPEGKEEILNSLSVEYDYFAQKIEPQYAKFYEFFNPLIEKLTEDKFYRDSLIVFPEEYIEMIAFMMITQHLRTPKARKYIIDLYSQTRVLFKNCVDANISLNGISVEDMKASLEENAGPVMTQMLIAFKPEFLKNAVEMLKSKIWSVYIALEGDFYTSDSPVNIEFTEDSGHDFMGINERGTIFTYPVSRKVLVRLWDREKFQKDFALYDRIPRYVDKEYVKSENTFQYGWATEMVGPTKDVNMYRAIKKYTGKELYYNQ